MSWLVILGWIVLGCIVAVQLVRFGMFLQQLRDVAKRVSEMEERAGIKRDDATP